MVYPNYYLLGNEEENFYQPINNIRVAPNIPYSSYERSIPTGQSYEPPYHYPQAINHMYAAQPSTSNYSLLPAKDQLGERFLVTPGWGIPWGWGRHHWGWGRPGSGRPGWGWGHHGGWQSGSHRQEASPEPQLYNKAPTDERFFIGPGWGWGSPWGWGRPGWREYPHR